MYLGFGIRNKYIRRFLIVFQLIYIFILGLFGAKFIHFGHLDLPLFNIIGRFFKSRVYLSAVTPYYHTYDDFDIFMKSKNIENYEINRRKPVGLNYIYFNKNSMLGLEKYEKLLKVYDVGRTRMRKTWINYIKKTSNEYFLKYHPSIAHNEEYAVFILGGFFTQDKYYYNFEKSMQPNTYIPMYFVQILEVLDKYCDCKVLLKPHAYTEMDFVNEKLLNYSDKFEITYLHPTTLSLHAKFFISTNYSITMADAHELGVPTIEYEKYSKEELKYTNNQSKGHPNVDYFLNGDKNLLKEVVNRLCKRKSFLKYDSIDDDSSGLIKDLST
jgi:hypothetical protein